MMLHCRISRLVRQGAGAAWLVSSSLHRRWRARRRAPEGVCILVVGSLRAGGSGKTDWVDWIASRHPGLAILVHPTGDEDVFLETRHPGRVFRHRDLVRAAELARDAGFHAAVADGGFQDPALDRHPAILLGSMRVPMERLHPFGPYRQRKPSRSVQLALREEVDWSWEFALDLAPGTEVLVAASVARDERVVAALERMGFRVAARLPTFDHRPFPLRAGRDLEAYHPGVPWVVTAKDAAAGRHAVLKSPCHVLRRVLVVPDDTAASVDALLPPF